MSEMPHRLKKLEVRILNPEFYEAFSLPTYATQGSAGLDIRACIPEETTLKAGEVRLIPSGLAIHIANPEFAGVLLPRSGLGHRHGIVLGNLTGLIDSDYQGEILVSLWNRSQKDYQLIPGERIAQLVLMPVQRVDLMVVKQFDEPQDLHKGFGHSGRL